MTTRGRLLTAAAALVLSAGVQAQTMVEYGAAAATGATGGVAGKGISDNLNKIFGKVDQQTQAAAKQGSAKQVQAPDPAPAPVSAPAPAPKAPAAKVARATAATKKIEPPSVPDPPALPNAAPVAKAPPPAPAPEPVVEPAPVAPPPPPPPQVTADDLKNLKPGTSRDDLLKLGAPAGKMMMFGDDGKLLEVYSYTANQTTFGVVRLNDGWVTKVELR